jgi:GT2 family glycosyltransferase
MQDLEMENTMVRKFFSMIWSHGFKYTFRKVYRKIRRKIEKMLGYDPSYARWRLGIIPTEEELSAQRKTTFSYCPVFSIVVPLYKTPKIYLDALIESIKAQTYGEWELCLSDGSGLDSPMKSFLEEYERDARIHVVHNERQLRISENTNEAIKVASGDFLVFADHDDLLAPETLFECAKALNTYNNLDIIYTDEDKISMDGKEFFQPHFKSDFNLDLLRSMNYISHLFVARRSLVEEVGMLRSEFDGSQDYDFILRCIEATEAIYHIPKVLYHWRAHQDSTAENPESKLYAFEAGQRAIQAHFDRLSIKALVTPGKFLGLYKTKYAIEGEPLISIVIPNKDHIEDLDLCIQTIEKKSTYRNYEYIIIENNSEKKETFDYYEKLKAANPKVTVITYEDKFNYSLINNYGVAFAKGEYILLMNNDTQIINEDCLEELLGVCMREDVGIVGARLFYEDHTIQHAGVVIGAGGIAGHAFVGNEANDYGYFGKILCMQDFNAVTAACMMVKKEIFYQVNGLSPELAVAFNDVDFCLKVRELGKLVVYNPYAKLYHYESKSRGLEDTPEKMKRFQKEIDTFAEKWKDILESGDPYYNPNFSLELADYKLKKIQI